MLATLGSIAQEPRVPITQEERDLTASRVRTHGIEAAAQLFGKYAYDDPWFKDRGVLAGNFGVVAADAHLVLVGRVAGARACLSDNRRQISTEYAVTPLEVLRDTEGALFVKQDVIVHLPGGQMAFENGSSAEGRTVGFRHMELGGRYVLAVSRPLSPIERCDADSAHKQYLFLWPEGLIALPEDGSPAQMAADAPSGVFKAFQGRPVNAILSEVRKQTSEVNRTHPTPRPIGR